MFNAGIFEKPIKQLRKLRYGGGVEIVCEVLVMQVQRPKFRSTEPIQFKDHDDIYIQHSESRDSRILGSC